MPFNKSKLSIIDQTGDIHQIFNNICNKRLKQLQIIKALDEAYEKINLLKGGIEHKRSEKLFREVAQLSQELKSEEERATQIESETLADFDISTDEYDSFYNQANREMLPLQREYDEAYDRLMNEISSLGESYRQLNRIKKSMAKIQSRKQTVDWMRSSEKHSPIWNKMLGSDDLQTNKDDTPSKIGRKVKETLEVVSKEEFRKDHESNNW